MVDPLQTAPRPWGEPPPTSGAPPWSETATRPWQ